MELVDRPTFALDETGMMINNTVFFITGKYIHFLIAYLNSLLCDWQFGKICATSGTGTRRWIKQYIEQIYVPIPTEEKNSKMKRIIEELNNANENTKAKLISKIDNMVVTLFNLNPEEQNFVRIQLPYR